MTKQVTALDTISGQVALVPKSYLKHPSFKDHLVEVPEGTKSYDPEFYKPKSKDEHEAKPTNKNKITVKPEDEKPALFDADDLGH